MVQRAHTNAVQKSSVASLVFGVQFAPRVILDAPNPKSGQRSLPMKKLLLVCFACTLLVSLVAAAQSTKQDDPATQDTAKTKAPEKQAEKPVKGTITVTGCLQKGDETGEFSIAGEDGKLWV